MTDLHMNGKFDTVNIAPSWEGIFAIIIETWSSQSSEGREAYRLELTRAATLLDGIEPLINALRTLINSQEEFTSEWDDVAKAIQNIVDASEL